MVTLLLVPANAATDLVGNGNLAAAPLVRTIDRVAPVVTLSTSQGAPTVERTFAVIVLTAIQLCQLSDSSGSFLPLTAGTIE